ncbi:MAG TPA: SDR family oxidoreductase [Thermoanaerobaculia bacterium]|nr:SDR family oxidoreductase [Thermoanaerobaculia bacterium]
MIFVTGAGGTVGSEVVRQLEAAGAKFRAAFHSEAKAEVARARGIDVVAIDYNRPETLNAALQSVERLFLLSGGAPDQEVNAVEAAKGAGVKHVVKLSVIGADEEAFSFAKLHRASEKAIEQSGLAWTFLRPNGFMQNLVTYSGGTIRAQGAFYSSVGDARISHVDVRDIAAVAVKALTEPGHEGKAYTLTGPEALTYDEMAGKISTASGRSVSYVNISDADLKQGLIGAGTPEPYADAYLDLMRHYRTGATAKVTDDVRRVTGRDARTFEEYAQDNATAWCSSPR